MADQTLAQNSSFTDMGDSPWTQQARQAISKVTARFPRFLRPGLLRESLYYFAAIKDPCPWVRGLYFRDRAPMEVEFRNGTRLKSSPRDSLFFLVEEIVADRCYTPRWFYKPGHRDVVVDIGANIGVFAAHICSLSSTACVTCFEPDHLSYSTLAQNVSASNLVSRVQVHQVAVWREQGVVHLALSAHDRSIVQRVVIHSDGAANPVKCVSLVEALDQARPAGGDIALLKIDAEGAETDILEAAGTAAMHRVRRVALEYHSAEKRIKCSELLRGYGFNVRWGRGDAETGICLAWRTA